MRVPGEERLCIIGRSCLPGLAPGGGPLTGLRQTVVLSCTSQILLAPYLTRCLPSFAPYLASVAPIFAPFVAACAPILAPLHSYGLCLSD